MIDLKRSMVASLSVAAWLLCGAQRAAAESAADLVRESLRQQSAAERAACAGVQRSIAGDFDPMLVVRTAVELGHNPCQTIRCAVEGKISDHQPALCEKVILGAVAAGVPSDVISRCAADVCDPAAVAAILTATRFEPNYCYLSPRAPLAPAALPPPGPVFGLAPLSRSELLVDRTYLRAQASPFTF